MGGIEAARAGSSTCNVHSVSNAGTFEKKKKNICLATLNL